MLFSCSHLVVKKRTAFVTVATKSSFLFFSDITSKSRIWSISHSFCLKVSPDNCPLPGLHLRRFPISETLSQEISSHLLFQYLFFLHLFWLEVIKVIFVYFFYYLTQCKQTDNIRNYHCTVEAVCHVPD